MDIKKLRNIFKLFEESNINRFELVDENTKIVLEKQESKIVLKENEEPIKVTKKIEEITTIENENNNFQVRAPLVGTYYESPSPDAGAFVHIGDTVNKGQVLCIIEAMKVMNEIAAPISGKIKKIHSTNGQLIEFEQLLFEIGD